MFLKSIRLTHFKNYLSEKFTFSEKINCVVGLNGMGKTNLLDAIYFLCMCKSRFSNSDRYILLKDEKEPVDFFRLEGQFFKNDKKLKVVAKVRPGNLKEFECEGAQYERLYEHVGVFPVIFVAPDDASLLLDGSESRRLLMDNVLSQMYPEYLLALVGYNRILKQRNAALKQFAEKGGFSPTLIQAYDEQMLAPAQLIFEHRSRFTEAFSPLLESFYKTISGGREQAGCKYESDLQGGDFQAILKKNADKDRLLARTTAGVHRDDIAFEMDGFPLKRFASQGQLKSFVLAAKLAQYESLRLQKKDPPILLLDDLFDKLDDTRVKNLLALLSGTQFGQIFLTDTHEQRAEEIVKEYYPDFKKIIIENGKNRTHIS